MPKNGSKLWRFDFSTFSNRMKKQNQFILLQILSAFHSYKYRFCAMITLWDICDSVSKGLFSDFNRTPTGGSLCEVIVAHTALIFWHHNLMYVYYKRPPHFCISGQISFLVSLTFVCLKILLRFYKSLDYSKSEA